MSLSGVLVRDKQRDRHGCISSQTLIAVMTVEQACQLLSELSAFGVSLSTSSQEGSFMRVLLTHRETSHSLLALLGTCLGSVEEEKPGQSC